MAQTYGNTWWGNYWLKALDHIDFANRIPRGATYARRGNVKEIIINGNHINAKVAGSRPKPYKVSITVPSFTPEEITRLIDRLVTRPSLISKLLNRVLDPEMLKIVEECRLNLFPHQWSDFYMECNCPDWAVPCKHLAAVIYMMSREIDNNPFIVFEIHKVNLLEELQKRGITLTKEEHLAVPKLADQFVSQPSKELTAETPDFRKIDFTRLRDISEPLVQLLPDTPAFYSQGNFLEKYATAWNRIVKTARKIVAQKVPILESPSPSLPPLSRRMVIYLEMHDSGNTRIVYRTAFSMQKGKKEYIPLKAEELPQALFDLPVDFLNDYQPEVAALQQALLFALHLLANGAVVPRIVQLSDRSFLIRWFPAGIDPQVRIILSELEQIFPKNTVRALLKSRKKPIPLSNQAECAVSFFLGLLIKRCCTNVKGDSFLEMLFKGNRCSFSGVGEQQLAGSIKAWLDRYFIPEHRYLPLFIVRESEGGEFLLDIHIEDSSRPEEKPVALSEIIVGKPYEKERFNILRELLMLESLIQGLNEYINRGATYPIRFNNKTFVSFLLKSIPAVRLLNVKVILPKSLQQLLRPQVTLRLDKKQTDGTAFVRLDDLLYFDWQIAVSDELLSPEEFRRLLKQASGLLRFKQNYIYVDEEDLEKIHKAFTQPPKLSSSRLLQAALTEEFESAPVQLSEEVRRLIRELTACGDIPLPEGIHATLRPYQQRGYTWMYRNMRIGFGSILADDMGLGKTLQVITLLKKIKDEGALEKKRALIVAPTGLLTNWQAEIERFAPGLSVFLYHGPVRDLKRFDSDILLTSYGILRSDATLLKKKKWRLMAIDEAQNIKNQDTAQSKAVRSIPADVHIALSGTPVENRLSEFWSIMEFTNKGYLDTPKKFREEFARPIQLFNDLECVKRFRAITAPFMMRRLKSDKSIIADLPDKIERNEFALLTRQQAALYDRTLQAAMTEIEGIDTSDSASLFRRQGLVLQMILALKQICNHPVQFLKNKVWDPELSGKAEMLLDLTEAIVASGEKVLVFTQFREMGDILQELIAKRLGERPMFYHGGCSMKERQEMVERFQSDRTAQVFLLSLKAAGTGLNLTAASHVIHYDLWWNPAVEAQATDRAYRIGQHNNVLVHRFITKNTFEEKIDRMIQSKKDLADLTVATGESWIGKLSNKELKELFTPTSKL